MALIQKLPEDLDLLEAGLSVENILELNSMYGSLMGSHNRDKNYFMLGQCIDDYDVGHRFNIEKLL